MSLDTGLLWLGIDVVVFGGAVAIFCLLRRAGWFLSDTDWEP